MMLILKPESGKIFRLRYIQCAVIRIKQARNENRQTQLVIVVVPILIY
jgi:hypothetical protein